MDNTLHDGLPDLLSIDNMANGAVYEMTTDALKKLAENIADVNTSPTQKRKIVITIEAAPYNDRSGAELTIKVENKLAGQKPATGTTYFARRNGEVLAFSRNMAQERIAFDMPEPTPEPAAKPLKAN